MTKSIDSIMELTMAWTVYQVVKNSGSISQRELCQVLPPPSKLIEGTLSYLKMSGLIVRDESLCWSVTAKQPKIIRQYDLEILEEMYGKGDVAKRSVVDAVLAKNKEATRWSVSSAFKRLIGKEIELVIGSDSGMLYRVAKPTEEGMYNALIIGGDEGKIKKVQALALARYGINVKWWWNGSGIPNIPSGCQGVVLFRDLCSGVSLLAVRAKCKELNIPYLSITHKLSGYDSSIRAAFPSEPVHTIEPSSDKQLTPWPPPVVPAKQAKQDVVAPSSAAESKPKPAFVPSPPPPPSPSGPAPFQRMMAAQAKLAAVDSVIAEKLSNIEEAKKLLEQVETELKQVEQSREKVADEIKEAMADWAAGGFKV